MKTELPHIKIDEAQAYRPIVHSEDPQLIFLHDILTHEECDRIVEIGERSDLFSPGKIYGEYPEGVFSKLRTSYGYDLTNEYGEFVADIDNRIAEIANWPVSKTETLHVMRYGPGQFFKHHFDWHMSSGPSMEKYGQRYGTMVLYLSDVEEGGETLFGKLGKIISPQKGCAVFFNYDSDNDPKTASKTLHAGHTVKKGVAYKMRKLFIQKDQS